jgi:hypothetical protein
MNDAKISGGYVLLARKIDDSDIMNQPPLYSKLWLWMLYQANWKDRDKLMRGQFVATIAGMQEACSHRVGYRKSTPSIGAIRSAYEAFTKATMITTAKTTRGMIITICNYDFYQNPANYEQHNEQHNEATTKPTVTTQDTEEGKEEKKETKPFAEKDSAGVSEIGSSPKATNPKKQAFCKTETFGKYFKWFWGVYALSSNGGRGRQGSKTKTRTYLEKSISSEDDALRFAMSVNEYLRQVDSENEGRPDDRKRSLKLPEGLAGDWQGYIPEDVEDRIAAHKAKKAGESLLIVKPAKPYVSEKTKALYEKMKTAGEL